MAEPLSDLLHRSVDDVDIPYPDTVRIAARGRGLRTRRRVVGAVAAAVLVGAVGIGGAVVNDLGDGRDRSAPDIANQPEAPDAASPEAAYARWGAWATGEQVQIGDTTVHLDHPVENLAQTSVGVVAQLRLGDGRRSFVLVRPDGTASPLSIPDTVVEIAGDLNASRVAWVEPRDGAMAARVWDVNTDAEVGTTTQPSPPTRADDDPKNRVALLDGDDVYFTTDDAVSFRVDWAGNGDGVEALPFLPLTAHNGVVVAHGGPQTGWVIYDGESLEPIRALGETDVNPSLSPDGERVLLVSYAASGAVTSQVEPVAGGDPVSAPGIGAFSSWTQDGSLISVDTERAEGHRCEVSGACERTDLEGVRPGDAVVLADYVQFG